MPLTGVEIARPLIVFTGTPRTFRTALVPGSATLPVTYIWSPMPGAGQGTEAATFTWTVTGTQTITVTASNCGGVAGHVLHFNVQVPVAKIYLPVVTR